MKQERNKEIDLLLRRLAGRDGEAAREAQATDDRHLDADELSSYAQNQLPAAARARYTEHLAECAPCRKLVTELSLSLGTVAVSAPVETVPVSSGLKRFLASLFSPLVLRYAVPALGVIVVMILGFVVLQQRQHELVATMNEQPKESVAVVATSPSPSRGFVDQQARTPEQAESGEPKPSEPKAKSGAGSGEVSGAGPAAAPVAPAKDKGSVAEVQAGVAPTPSPSSGKAAPGESEPPATTTDKIATKQPAEVNAKLDAEAAKQRANVNESGRNEVRIAQSTVAEREKDKPKAAPSGTGGFSGVGALARNRPAGARGTTDTKRQEEKSAEAQTDEETRTIAGRRFRKERGIWTDTAYDSSTATVNMARDSEQFRALVADEPAIGTIAKQLDGELIVVWKGRAYRIR